MFKNLLIAEVGSVHDGSFGNACKLIEAAAANGAGAVKFQTHLAEAETLASAPSPVYFKNESRIEYFRRTGFSLEQWRTLRTECDRYGAVFLSSPFSLEAVDWLEKVGVCAYKIPSGEVTNLPLLKRVAETGKPALLSSGMSSWDELDRAVECLSTGGPLTLMQCSSIYPCPYEKVGLNILSEMRRRYGVSVGYSDHTMGFSAPIAAAALGAIVIEKHFTFSRLMYGSDAQHSMEPAEFVLLARSLREVWQMLSHPVDKSEIGQYAEMKRIFEKSLVLISALSSGTILEERHLAFKKPGDGIRADRWQEMIGRRLVRDLPADHKLSWNDVT